MDDKETVTKLIEQGCDNCKNHELQLIQIPGGSKFCKSCWDEISGKRDIKKLESENAGLREEMKKVVASMIEWETECIQLKARISKLLPWFESRMHPKTGWLKPIHITDIRKLLGLESGGEVPNELGTPVTHVKNRTGTPKPSPGKREARA